MPVDEVQLSYPFLSKEKRNDRYFYFDEMADFLPDKEFEVTIVLKIPHLFYLLASL
jgi:hypothetical protein